MRYSRNVSSGATSYSSRTVLHSFLLFIAACALGLGVATESGYRQVGRTKTNQVQKVTTTTQATAERRGNERTSVRPFRDDIPEQVVEDMPRSLATTRLPDEETTSDAPQGAQLANLHELVRAQVNEIRLAQGRIVVPPGHESSATE